MCCPKGKGLTLYRTMLHMAVSPIGQMCEI